MTSEGHFGICQDVRPHDHVVLIAGCDMAFVVRKADDEIEEQDGEYGALEDAECKGKFRLVGEALIPHVADVSMWPKNEEELVEIALV